MTSFSEIWHLIIYSNLFNFAIFLLILIVVAKKVDIASVLENMRMDVVKKIDEAKNAKNTALEDLEKAEKSVENLAEDIKNILTGASKNAESMSKQILDDAENKIKSYEVNAQKAIEAEEKYLISKLTLNQGEKSIDMAFNHIKKTLKDNPQLHDKFINQSIDELDKINLG